MKKVLSTFGAMLCCAYFVSYAQALQPRVLDVRPSSEGRTVSIEESQLPGLRPLMPRFFWTPEGELTKTGQINETPRYTLPEPEGPGVVYGQSVSRNEFGGDTWVFPSPDSSRLLVYRKDESRVTEFPLLDITTRTGSLKSIRYPMNGMASEHIDLCVCDTLGHVLNTLAVSDFTEERYLTNPSWSPDGKYIIVQVLDRAQHNMHMNCYLSEDGSFVRTILFEADDRWTEPLDPVIFLTDDVFIYRTDCRDGWRNLYLCNLQGGVRRLTCTDADVQFVAYGDSRLFYTSAEVSPVENHLFAMPLKQGKTLEKWRAGKSVRLTSERGWHNISLSPDHSRFIDSWTSFDNPGRTVVRSSKDGSVLEDLATAKDMTQGVAQPEIEFGTVPSADGVFDNYYRFFKPCGFDPTKKYPLIVYVYGGPHSQMVQDKWLGNIRLWELAMAQRGYAVYVQDNRGTQRRGEEYEKAINGYCGQRELEDQMAGLESLLERNPWIDRDRIGVHGWSYGGFMALTMTTAYPDIFKVAVAGGPVIDWKWYEIMYGERYMDTEETNPDGFETTSLIGKVCSLKKAKDAGQPVKILICQGAIDDTVVWEHSLSFTQKCIEYGVPLDYFPYPLSKHNMAGKSRIHLYEKITDYFMTNL